MFRKKIRFIFLVIAISLFVILFFYAREEQLISRFESGLESLLSEATGWEVSIGGVGGNIFKKIILYDLSCESGDYSINFGRAQLDYFLWEVLSKRKSGELFNNNLLELTGGSLRFKDKLIVSEQINGRIRLKTDKIVIEGLDFKLFSFSDNHIKGEITGSSGLEEMDLRLKCRPLFDRADLFKETAIDIKGPINDLSFGGGIIRREDSEILLNGAFGFSKEILRFSSGLDFKDLKTGRVNSFFTDVEVNSENSSFRMVITPAEGSIIINGDYSKWPFLAADITNDHIRIFNLDFSNIIHLASDIIFKEGAFSHVALDIYTESTILNYYPFDEFEISCRADKDLLRFTDLKAGNSISASGALSLKGPHKAFLKVTLDDFNVSHLLRISKEEEAPIASGRMSGEVMIEGPLDDLRTKVNLRVSQGYIGTIDYEDMVLNMTGVGPILTVYDSRLIREDSYMTMDGTMDIREIGKDKFLENLEIGTDPNTIIWDGWDISKADEESKLSLSKGVDRRIKVGFTAHISNDETAYQPVKPQNEFELEYKMPDEESLLQLKAKEKEEFLGLEKKYKF